MEKIIWADSVKNDEVLQKIKEERNILLSIKRRKAKCICHMLRGTNCFIKHITKEKMLERIEVTGRRGRLRKQLLDNLKGKRGYWKLKEDALNRTTGELALQADMVLS